jgi:signal transduction histidine kinase
MNTGEPSQAKTAPGADTDPAAELEQLRRQLHSTQERLQQAVAEREVFELRDGELQRALRARQRLQTLGTLAGGLAHEINNCLLPITLHAQSLLEGGALDDTARVDVEAVLSAARRAKRVVEQLLGYARQTGKPVPERIALRDPVSEALRLIQTLASPAIDLQYDLTADCPPVIGDSAMLVQLVVNLCTNALQAMRERGGTLSVKLSPQSADGSDPAVARGRYACLAIADTGGGMDAATQEQMFQPFFTTRPPGQGTGLGLAVVYEIVQRMRGLIRVSSAPDRGTQVQVLFPAADQ